MLKPSDAMAADLMRSGLTPEDLNARPLEASERSAAKLQPGTEGYVLPYYDIYGKPLPFYRVRLFNVQEGKYRQLKGSRNHLYFPKGFMEALRKSKSGHIIITEGEKKAKAALNAGYPAIGLSGASSWKTSSILISNTSEISQYSYNQKLLCIKLAPGQSPEELLHTPYAEGLMELLTTARQMKKKFVIVLDSDSKAVTKENVQREAAKLGHMLRREGFGMHEVKQLILPIPEGEDKSALDDFFLNDTARETFGRLFKAIMDTNRAFPRDPTPFKTVGRMLGRKLTRDDYNDLGKTIIAELDASGRRMHSPEEGVFYYFNDETSELMEVHLGERARDELSQQPFGQLLYKRFGIYPGNDKRLVGVLNDQFPNEKPVSRVSPHRNIAIPKRGADTTTIQLTDNKYVHVDKDGINIRDNGDDNILFLTGQAMDLDFPLLERKIAEEMKKPAEMVWGKVLSNVRLRNRGDNETLLALLYYISPWLFRWRGMQLPVEFIIGEPGSGKSSMYTMRLNILQGKAELRNMPNDVRDWRTTLANSGSLVVTDNVQLMNNTVRTQISDEICRLVTEPQPTVRTRVLYTTNQEGVYKANVVFAFTALSQPFNAGDLIQRSIITELDKSTDERASYNATWVEDQMELLGGREGWLAHHLVILHKFFKAVEKNWDPKYKALYRLINFEQAAILMARDVFGIEADWIPEMLAKTVNSHIMANDAMLSGLRLFAETHRGLKETKQFKARDISTWASKDPDFNEHPMLTNTHKVGNYIRDNAQNVFENTGIKSIGTRSRVMHYLIDAKQLKEEG